MSVSALDTLRITDVTEETYPTWLGRFLGTFGHTVERDPDTVDYFRGTHPLDRAIAVVDDSGSVVATGSAIDLDLVLPGGSTVAMAGVTGLTVDPTVRRRGVLRAMMTHLHRRAVEEGHPIAGLGASEWPIYGRFGYGPATWFNTVNIDSRNAGWRDDAPGNDPAARRVDGKEARELAQRIHQSRASHLPGEVVRSSCYWDRLSDHSSEQIEAALGLSDTGSGPRHSVAVGERGLLVYRIKSGWTVDATPDDTLHVIDFLAADNDAAATLWRHLLSVDLVTNIHASPIAIDDPSQWWVADARRLRPRRHDGLWLRPLNIVKLLEAREWFGNRSLTITVHDREGYAQGTYKLDIDAGHCTCKPSSGQPDLEMDVSALGAITLGGTPATSLARSGRIHSPNPHSAHAWDNIASAPRAPFTTTTF